MSDLKEIRGYIQPFMLNDVLHGLAEVPDLPVVVVSDVFGWTTDLLHEPSPEATELAHKTRIEIVVPEGLVPAVVDTIHRVAKTGNIFVADVTKPRDTPRGAIDSDV